MEDTGQLNDTKVTPRKARGSSLDFSAHFIEDSDDDDDVNHPPRRKAEKKIRFSCDICQKGFSNKKSLEIHVRLHTREKWRGVNRRAKSAAISSNTHVSCPVCKKTIRRQHLKIHMRVHTQEKPFKCSTCNKRLSYSNSLANHIRVHTGEKPYRCSKCNTCFRNLASLTHHVIKRDQNGQVLQCRDILCRRYSRKILHQKIRKKDTPPKDPRKCFVKVARLPNPETENHDNLSEPKVTNAPPPSSSSELIRLSPQSPPSIDNTISEDDGFNIVPIWGCRMDTDEESSGVPDTSLSTVSTILVDTTIKSPNFDHDNTSQKSSTDMPHESNNITSTNRDPSSEFRFRCSHCPEVFEKVELVHHHYIRSHPKAPISVEVIVLSEDGPSNSGGGAPDKVDTSQAESGEVRSTCECPKEKCASPVQLGRIEDSLAISVNIDDKQVEHNSTNKTRRRQERKPNSDSKTRQRKAVHKEITELRNKKKARNEKLTTTRPRSSEKGPFKCPHCGKELWWKHNFKKHLLHHSTKGSFKCSVCSRGFSRPEYVNRHEAFHSDARPFQCIICDAQFKYRASVYAHCLRVHQKRGSYKFLKPDMTIPKKPILSTEDLLLLHRIRGCEVILERCDHLVMRNDRRQHPTSPEVDGVTGKQEGKRKIKNFRRGRPKKDSRQFKSITSEKKSFTKIPNWRKEEKKCRKCGKTLGNYFSLKRHYKIMHHKELRLGKKKGSASSKDLKVCSEISVESSGLSNATTEKSSTTLASTEIQQRENAAAAKIGSDTETSGLDSNESKENSTEFLSPVSPPKLSLEEGHVEVAESLPILNDNHITDDQGLGSKGSTEMRKGPQTSTSHSCDQCGIIFTNSLALKKHNAHIHKEEMDDEAQPISPAATTGEIFRNNIPEANQPPDKDLITYPPAPEMVSHVSHNVSTGKNLFNNCDFSESIGANCDNVKRNPFNAYPDIDVLTGDLATKLIRYLPSLFSNSIVFMSPVRLEEEFSNIYTLDKPSQTRKEDQKDTTAPSETDKPSTPVSNLDNDNQGNGSKNVCTFFFGGFCRQKRHKVRAESPEKSNNTPQQNFMQSSCHILTEVSNDPEVSLNKQEENIAEVVPTEEQNDPQNSSSALNKSPRKCNKTPIIRKPPKYPGFGGRRRRRQRKKMPGKETVTEMVSTETAHDGTETPKESDVINEEDSERKEEIETALFIFPESNTDKQNEPMESNTRQKLTAPDKTTELESTSSK